MRARRLRHLALIGGSESTITAASSGPEIDENDDTQHKQKQQKIDNDLEVGLNNNDPLLSTETKTVSNCLTQRSRLLDDIEKQQLENRINQNIKDTGIVHMVTDSSSDTIEMDTDDHESSRGDGDSSIERMDTDDIVQQPTELTIKRIIDQPLSMEKKQLEAEICMSRILDAFWAEHCEGSIALTETADMYKESFDEDRMQFDDLSFQIMSEIIMKYFRGDCIGFKTATNLNEYEKQIMAAMENKDTIDPIRVSVHDLCTGPKILPHNLPAQAAVIHMIKSFNRCAHEQDRYSSNRNRNKFETYILDAIDVVKKQLVSISIVLLEGKIIKHDEVPIYQQTRSVLLALMSENEVPPDFLELVFFESFKTPERFTNIFERVLLNLFLDMQVRVVSKDIDIAPINILRQLTELTVDRARPICDLITKLNNFNPPVCSGIGGRQIIKCSFLGPFLSLSVFNEENPKLAEEADEEWETNFAETIRLVNSHFSNKKKNKLLISSNLNFAFSFDSNWIKCAVKCTEFSMHCYEARKIDVMYFIMCRELLSIMKNVHNSMPKIKKWHAMVSC